MSLRGSAFVALVVAIGLFVPPAASGPRPPRTDVSRLWLDGAGQRLETALLDAPRGYAYFGTDLGTIARIRLSDLSRDGTLAAGGPPAAAAIDASREFAYFGVREWDDSAQVVKVDLADFTIAMTLTLPAEDGHVGALVLDEAGGYAYLATDTQPGKVVQVRLADLVRTRVLVLDAGEDDLQAAVLDAAAGYAYFGTNTRPGRVVRVRLSDFTRVDALALGAGEDYVACAALDATAGYAYFGTHTGPGRIVRVRLADMAAAGTLLLQTPSESYDFVNAATLDATAGFAYFVTGQQNPSGGSKGGDGAIVQVRLADFAWVASATPPPPPPYNVAYGSLVVDAPGGTAYLGGSWYFCGTPSMTCVWEPAHVASVHLPDLATIDEHVAGEDRVTSALADGAGYGYFGAYTGQIVKVRFSDLTRVVTLDLPYDDERLDAGAIDPAGGYAYFGTDTAPGRVYRVRLSDFSDAGVLTLAAGEDHVTATVVDPAAGDAYFGTETGFVVKVRLSDFTRVGALALPGRVGSAVIDPAGRLAYFGFWNVYSGGNVARIALDDFTPAGTVALCAAIYRGAVIDLLGGFAYFATAGCAGQYQPEVARVRLSDFSFAGALPLDHVFATSLDAAALDPAAGVIYWGYNECIFTGGECDNWGGFRPMRVTGFNWAGDVDGLSPFPRVAAFDGVSGAAIVGDDTQPGALYRFYLGDGADLALAGTAAPAAVPPGAELTYEFMPENDGPRAATGIALTSTLAVGVTFRSASPGCAEAGGVVTCTAGDLRWGASEAITLAVLLDATAPPGLLVTTAQASAAEPDGDVGNNTVAVTVTVLMLQAWLPAVAR